MEFIYFIASVLLILGLPAGIIITILGIIKPALIHKWFPGAASRKIVAKNGLITLFAGGLIVSGIANATMPESMRKEQQMRQTVSTQEVKVTPVQQKTETKKETKVETIRYNSTEVPDATLAQGVKKTKTSGVNGIKTETYEVTYKNNLETERKLVKSEITTAAVDEVISVGTYVAPPVRSIAPTYSTPAPSTSSDVYYANCSAARAAGAAPIYRGQPGYRSPLDRDNDGIACE